MPEENQEVDVTEKKTQSLNTLINGMKYYYFSFFFSTGLIFNFEALMLKKAGIDASSLATIMSSGLIAGIISPICLGYIADRTKKSKIIVSLTVILTVLFLNLIAGYIAYVGSFIPTKDVSITEGKKPQVAHSIIMLLSSIQFIITFCDLGSKSLTDGVSHIICDMSKKVGKTVEYSKIRMFGAFGGAMATLSTGLLLDHVAKVIPSTISPTSCLMVISLITGFSCFVCVILYVPNVENIDKVSLKSAVKAVYKQPIFMIVLLAQFFIQSAIFISRSFDNIYIDNLHASKTIIGFAGFIQAIFESITMLFSSSIIQLIGSNELATVIICCLGALRTFIYSYADNPWLPLNNSVLTGFIAGIQNPALSLTIKSMAPKELIISFISLLATVGKIGSVISTKVGGSLINLYGHSFLYKISSAISVLAISILLLAIYFEKRKMVKMSTQIM